MQSFASSDTLNHSAEFFRQFQFREERRGALGVEREFFLHDEHGRPVAASHRFLAAARARDAQGWQPELSACQVEVATPPCRDLEELAESLQAQNAEGHSMAEEIGARLVATELAPDDMTLEVYPHPRYQEIAQRLPRSALLASCQLAATHIHVGVGDIAEAIAVYGRLRAHLPEMMQAGNHSGGHRLRRYAAVAPRWQPPPIHDAAEFYQAAVTHEFAHPPNTPKDCWWLVRISPVGSVEVRAFGSCDSVERILGWAEAILNWAQTDD